MNQLTRDHGQKCDKSKYWSNNASAENNSKSVLKRSYWSL